MAYKTVTATCTGSDGTTSSVSFRTYTKSSMDCYDNWYNKTVYPPNINVPTESDTRKCLKTDYDGTSYYTPIYSCKCPTATYKELSVGNGCYVKGGWICVLCPTTNTPINGPIITTQLSSYSKCCFQIDFYIDSQGDNWSNEYYVSTSSSTTAPLCRMLPVCCSDNLQLCVKYSILYYDTDCRDYCPWYTMTCVHNLGVGDTYDLESRRCAYSYLFYWTACAKIKTEWCRNGYVVCGPSGRTVIKCVTCGSAETVVTRHDVCCCFGFDTCAEACVNQPVNQKWKLSVMS